MPMAFLDKLLQMHYITIFSLMQQKTPERSLARQEIVSFYKFRPFSLVIFIKGISDYPTQCQKYKFSEIQGAKKRGYSG